MTYSIIATLAIADGKLEEAASTLTSHAAWVKENEPGTLTYNVHKSKGKNVLIVYEQYKDKAAFDLHSANLVQHAGSLMTMLAGKPDILVLEDV